MAVVMLNCLLFVLFCIIVFNFGGYPVLLKSIARFKKVDHSFDSRHTPSVTLLIAAYNEGSILKQKLENSQDLDYPKDLLQILLVSDGSSDETNDIAKTFEAQGIKLIVNPNNMGKASSLNIGMQNITSDLVVLSDANVMYQPDGIRKLARHFSDQSIGAVSGKVVLLNQGLSYSDAENTYYDVEHNIQQLESDTGNLIGADGAMYALRRELFRPLEKDTLLDDFVLSMGVVQQGKRLIFDPEALGFEQNLSEMDSEYRRKVRIVAGGIQCLRRKTAWPPSGQTLTALKFICHKILRWIIGPTIVMFLFLLLVRGLIAGSSLTMPLAMLAALVCVALLLATKLIPSLSQSKYIKLLIYLLVMIKASIVGCYKALITKQQISWR